MATNLRAFTIGLTLIAAATALACGDGPDAADTTPTSSPSLPSGATPTQAIGPNPVLGNYVTAISPGNGDKVTQESTRTLDPQRPRGVCFSASFRETPEQAQWFRMAVDGQEVTTKLTWVVGSLEGPQAGRACYAPTEGLKAGRHTAAVTVQNPRNFNEPARLTVAWAFDVSP